jgi:dTDP-alpha-D-glucose dehydrogenase
VIITVGTPVDGHGCLVIRPLVDACQRLNSRLRRGQLVILKSTVSAGTTRALVAPLLEAGRLVHGVDLGLASAPSGWPRARRWPRCASCPCGRGLRPAQHGGGDPVLGPGARCPGPGDALRRGGRGHQAGDQLVDRCQHCDRERAGPVLRGVRGGRLDVVAGANSLPKGNSRVNILLPSVGVGGPCLTKDPGMAWQDGRDRGLNLEPSRRRAV